MCKCNNKGVYTLFKNKKIRLNMIVQDSRGFCELELTRDLGEGLECSQNDFFDIYHCPLCGRKLWVDR